MSEFMIHSVIHGAALGLIGAIVADLDAWKSGDPLAPFDWKKAGRRYLYAVLLGASAGAGIGSGIGGLN